MARCGGSACRGARSHNQRGQSTVEFALVLPVLLMFFLALLQIAVVAREQIRTQHAARVAAREASVDAGFERVLAATKDALEDADVEFLRRGEVGEPIEVRVRHTVKTSVPIVGALVPDVELEANAVMRRER